MVPRQFVQIDNYTSAMKQKQQFPKNHPYSRSLDEVLSHYFVTRTDVPAVHGEDYEEMKELILDALFYPKKSQK